MLQYGLKWRVGDSARVNAWSDTWLPRPWSHEPVTAPYKLLPYLATVNNLIDH